MYDFSKLSTEFGKCWKIIILKGLTNRGLTVEGCNKSIVTSMHCGQGLFAINGERLY